MEGEVTIKMDVTDGHLLRFEIMAEGSEWQPFSYEADASYLVPWGMGFRLGMFAKGQENQMVNFTQTRIVNH